MVATPTLTTNQRYIYTHYLHHKQNNKLSPCFVPRSPRPATTVANYLRALDKLEALGLVSIDRSAPHYTGWIILPPVN